MKAAVEAAKAENRAALDTHLNPYRTAGVTMPGNPIGDAIDGTIPTSLQIEAQTNPDAAMRVNAIHQVANAYRQHQFTVDELRNLAIETNGDLNAFYHKTADAQNAALAQQGGQAVLEAKASAIRDMMRQYFGPDAAEIQQRWGWLDDVDAGLDAAYKKVLNQKPVSPADATLRAAGAPGKMLHGDVEGARYALTPGGKINSLLQRAFDQTEPSGPLPTAQPGQGFGGFPQAAAPGRQLPPATPQLNAGGANGSYVSTSGLPPGPQVNVWQGIGARRALPPGSARPGDFSRPAIVTPPPADASFVRSAPGMAEPPNPSRALPRASTFMVPPSEASGIHPTTGTPPTGPSYGVTPESIATKLGRSIYRALGGPQ